MFSRLAFLGGEFVIKTYNFLELGVKKFIKMSRSTYVRFLTDI